MTADLTPGEILCVAAQHAQLLLPVNATTAGLAGYFQQKGWIEPSPDGWWTLTPVGVQAARLHAAERGAWLP